jgi:hypothetical protein
MRSSEDPRRALLERFHPDHSPLVALGLELGPDVLDAVLRQLGPSKPHIPDREAFWVGLERELRDERIRVEFDGTNVCELAERYSLSPRWVRQILAGKK